MKKTKFFAFLLMFTAFIMAGCTFGGNQLKRQSSNMSVMEFYSKMYLEEVNKQTGATDIKINDETGAYSTACLVLTSVEDEMFLIVTAMDFIIELENNPEIEETRKIYEFEEAEFNDVLIVDKEGSKFVVKRYLTAGDATHVTENELISSMDVKLTGLTKEIYTLTYKVEEDTFGATFTYDSNKGYMKVGVEILGDDYRDEITREIRAYVGGVKSVRTFANTAMTGVYSNDYVLEMMIKPFYVRSKIAQVSNKSLMSNLNRITEDDIASANSSDKWCYVVESEASEKLGAISWRTWFTQHGEID